MQDGPRFLTDLDINTAYAFTNLTAGAGGGSTNSTNQTAAGLTLDFTNLGQIGQTADGRKYRLCTFASATTVVPGTFLVQQASSSAFAGLVVGTVQPANTAFYNAENNVNSATTKGSVSFNVINGSTAITADQFAGGFVQVLTSSATAGTGPVSFKLQGNTSAAANGNVTLYLADALNVPYTLKGGTDKVNLVPCPWANVVATTVLGAPAGVLTAQVPNSSSAGYAAWVQIQGEAVAIGDATSAILGGPVSQSTTTSGDLTYSVSATTTGAPVGFALSTGSGTLPVFLTLD